MAEISDLLAVNQSLARLAGYMLQLADNLNALTETVERLATRVTAVEAHVERLVSPLHRQN